MIKYISFLLLLLTFTYPKFSLAQTPCVVGPVPSFENNRNCTYYNYSDSSADFNSSCYQKYLVTKNDWVTRCFRYWDSQQNTSNNSNNNPTITPIKPTDIPISTPVPTKHIIKIINTPVPSVNPTLTITPTTTNEVSNEPTQITDKSNNSIRNLNILEVVGIFAISGWIYYGIQKIFSRKSFKSKKIK